MGKNLFAYGTLVVPSLFEKVVGKPGNGINATLRGYSRFLLKDKCYPGISPTPGDPVDGVVYFDLDDSDFEKLDQFEGDIYERINVKIVTEEKKIVAADTYVLVPKKRHLLSNETWDLQTFIDVHLAKYLA